MIITHIKTNFTVKNTCDGVGCLKEATQTIEEKVGTMGTITLQLCKDCTNTFCNAKQTKKKRLERTPVARPACSDTLTLNQPIQQHGGLLDD
jgi:hypothetical protein